MGEKKSELLERMKSGTGLLLGYNDNGKKGQLRESKRERMAKVYRASGEVEAQIIKGLLESNGIPCLLKSNAAHSVHMFVVDGMGEVGVMVWESMVEKARGLIEEEDYV